MTRSVRYQPIFNTLYYTLHTGHAYCLSYRFFNNVVITTVIEMVEMVEILDGRLGKRSVERVRYVINNLLHLVIVKYGDISLVLCISTRLRLVTILPLLVKYLVILHADPCNKSYIYIYMDTTTDHFTPLALRVRGNNRVAIWVTPTNTKFKPLLLPYQVGMLYTNTHKYRTSYFKSTLTFLVWVQLSTGSPFLPPDKTRKFLRFFIINNVIRE